MIRLLKWYDTVTQESAEHGDYESTGNGELALDYDNIVDAATQFASWLKAIGHYELPRLDVNLHHDYASEVVYAIDGDVNFDDGSTDYDRLAVIFAESSQTDKIKLIFNAEVNSALIGD